MEEFVFREGKMQRRGVTTGLCAAAAAKGAAAALLGGTPAETVSVKAKDGTSIVLDILDLHFDEHSAFCAVIKDAGDDPDVTDGLAVQASVEKIPRGIEIDGGEGVGRVTKAGLPVKAGEAAINPVPRRMIEEALLETAKIFGYGGGFKAVISVPGGEEVAKKTFNPQLGIEGGISILGTTGIVEPMSTEALLRTIYLLIDQKVLAGYDPIVLCPGNYGLDYAKDKLGIGPDRAVKCSNFIGKTLDYCVYKKVKNILLVGHSGKLVKLAAGVFDTHSKTADCRGEIFAAHAAIFGALPDQIRQILDSPTTSHTDSLLTGWGLTETVWESILSAMEKHLIRRVRPGCRVEAVIFTNDDSRAVYTKGARELILQCKENRI